MDLRTLYYFVAVAEELNITRAAERLCISQPPLSSQIKNLEKELNTVLFIRGKRHLQLTDSGKLLYRRAKEILSLTDKATSEIISMSSGMTGTIAIGLVEGSAPDIAANWIYEFRNLHPKINFLVKDGNSDELIGMLRSGLINLAVITSPCDNTLLNSFVVGRDRMTAFMSKDHALSQLPGDTLDLAQLKDMPLIVPSRDAIVNMIYKWFGKAGFEPQIVCKMDNYLDVAAMSGKNIGVSLFPKTSYVYNPQLIAKEVVNPELYLEYNFVWLKGKPLPEADESFIDCVKLACKV